MEDGAYPWAGLLNVVGGVLLTGIIGWVASLRKQVNTNETDLKALSGQVSPEGAESLPTQVRNNALAIEALRAGIDPEEGAALRNEIDDVHSRVTEVVKEIAHATGKMDSVQGQLKMIHEHLLGNGRNK